MSGFFWNVRGLGNPSRTKFIRETIMDRDLCFLGIQETKKKEISDTWLDSLTGRKNFFWSWVPSQGLSGGMLMGVDDEIFEVGDCNGGAFYIHMTVKLRTTGFTWNLVNIYGASHENDKEIFLIELSQVFGMNSHPFLVGGDFNLIRKVEEINKYKDSSKWSFLCNGIIEHWGLTELEMSGRKYT